MFRKSREKMLLEKIENSVEGQSKFNARGVNFDADEVLELIAYLIDHSEITEGNFYFCNRSYHFITVLIRINTLKTLEFYQSDWLASSQMEKELSELAHAIEYNTQLTTLSLPALPNDKMQLITRAIRKNLSLTSISLTLGQWNELGQEEAMDAVIEDIIKGNPRINSLSLHAEEFQEETLLKLFEALKCNPLLFTLRLYGVTHMNETLAKKLADITNQREVAIELALFYSFTISPAVEAIFLQSKTIISLEANPGVVSPVMQSLFNKNKERFCFKKRSSSKIWGSGIFAAIAEMVASDKSRSNSPNRGRKIK